MGEMMRALRTGLYELGDRGDRMLTRPSVLAGAAAGVADLTTGGTAFRLDWRSDLESRELNTSAAPLAAFTFDDGSDPELTSRILEVLAQYWRDE